jgi:hypothetical protein
MVRKAREGKDEAVKVGGFILWGLVSRLRQTES